MEGLLLHYRSPKICGFCLAASVDFVAELSESITHITHTKRPLRERDWRAPDGGPQVDTRSMEAREIRDPT
jgi:hypothetical protein